MTSLGPFDVKLCILCEDVREERNNKYSLMGIYSGDILISEIPGHIPMCLYIETLIKEVGSHDVEFRFSGPGKHSAILKGRAELPNKGSLSVLRTPRIELGVQEAGTFQFDMRADNGRWKSLITKTISLMASGPTA